MPPYRSHMLTSTGWGSKGLNHEAYILHRPSNNTMALENLKVSGRIIRATFRQNDGQKLVDDISLAKEASYGSRAGAAAATARQKVEIEVQEYIGRVKSLEDNNVIAEIGPPDDMDRWDAIIPRASFIEQPQLNQEIACRILRSGSHIDITVQILSNRPLPELKDFGIDKEELLNWASQIDV
jgi:hypothetical protein